MSEVEHSTKDASSLQDLVFELSEAVEAKFCIGVCDDFARREGLTKSIQEQLTPLQIETLVIKLRSGMTDLVESLRQRTKAKKKQVAVVYGFEDMEEDSLNVTLSYFNFKRDILLSLQIPILFWVSNTILNRMVAKAPDFWSRRTVTHYFTSQTVTELLTRLFEHEAKQIKTNGKVFQVLRRVFSHERELEQILQHSKEISPVDIHRLMSEINLGITDLITECHMSNAFEVSFRLWVLADIDRWLKRMAQNISRYDAPFALLYEERMEILLGVADKMTKILENYQSNLEPRVREGRKVNLLGYFIAYVEAETQRVFETLTKDKDIKDRMLATDSEELAEREQKLQGSMMRDFQQKAADELLLWIELKEGKLPAIFSVEEGKILRLLFRGKRRPAAISKALGVSEEEAMAKIDKLKTKVLLFIGVDPWS